MFLDDDADVLAAAELVLNRSGFVLATAQNPEEAETRLAADGFDLLLLDLNFRRGDTSGEAGLAFLRRHMQNRPHLPVVVNHDDSPMGVSQEVNDGVFVRSVYFTDPNGIMMEFAAWTRAMRPDDVRHEPKGAVVEA